MKKIMFLIVLSFCGCIPNMMPPKKIVRVVKTETAEVEWSRRASAYNEAPGIVVIKRGSYTATICRSTNIADLKSVGDQTLLIGFYGFPSMYSKSIQIPKSILGHSIIIDTSYSVQLRVK